MLPILFIASLILIISCAPLQRHDSAWGTAGEIAFRAVVAPLTLGTSELILAHQAQVQRERRQYQDWYESLSEERQQREDRRTAAAQYGLGMALSGGLPFRSFQSPIYQTPVSPIPPYVVPPRQSTSCLANTMGNTTYYNCN